MPSQITWDLRGRVVKVGTADPPTQDVSCQVVSIGTTLAPQTNTVPAVACADPRQEITTAIRSFTLVALNDRDTAAGLAWFLADHNMQPVWFMVEAGAGKGGWKAQVTAIDPPWDAAAGTPHQYTLNSNVLSYSGIKPT